jgi:nitrogen regulatory protein P-II 1
LLNIEPRLRTGPKFFGTCSSLKKEEGDYKKMKEVRAIIRVEKLGTVKDALEGLGLPGLMVTHVEGHGRQKGLIEQFRGREFKVDLLPKVRMEIVCLDKDVEQIIQTIADSARTGEIGDGKIFVYNVEDAIRIRSMERGEAAI